MSVWLCCCVVVGRHVVCFFFFFNDTATTEIYTLSLHDALPIFEEKNSSLTVVRIADRIDVQTEGLPEGVKPMIQVRSEEHTSELQSRLHLVCRLLLEKKKKQKNGSTNSQENKQLQHDVHTVRSQ